MEQNFFKISDSIKECDKKALEGMELEWIKSGYYPLNLKDNNKISDEWKNYLQNKRKQLVSK